MGAVLAGVGGARRPGKSEEDNLGNSLQMRLVM